MQSLEAHQAQVEDAIAQGKALAQQEGALELVESNVTRLESLSSSVVEDCKNRREELETSLINWSRYNEGLEGFKEILAKGEVEITQRKALNVSGIEGVTEQTQAVEVSKIFMNFRMKRTVALHYLFESYGSVQGHTMFELV